MEKTKESNQGVAIYPGSFDPITNGHLAILKRALKVFNKVIISILEHKDKNPLFSVKERKEMITKVTKGLNVEIDSFDGLLAEYVKTKETHLVIRSLRATNDFDYEFQMAIMNSNLNPDMESIFFMAGKEYIFLSSSSVKEVAKHGGDVSMMVPQEVVSKLKDKFS